MDFRRLPEEQVALTVLGKSYIENPSKVNWDRWIVPGAYSMGRPKP